ncbi:MAG: GGDEF domain-containing protein [Lachnospiraceae bacterium]|nr:GGDEF domain-containing protein [Lachnospiraceae bacterium]
MSRKKIALFSAGWASNILAGFLRGVHDGFSSLDVDTYLFLCYATYGQSESERSGELKIFKLPDLKDFDGAIIISNLCDFPGVLDDLVSRCNKVGIPVISHGIPRENAVNIIMDNDSGMNDLTRHLITEHGVKDIIFVAGTADNSDSAERMESVRNTALSHGLTFTDENVVYSDWEFAKAAEIARNFANKGKLPDAFICANDEIAMVMITTFEDYGISVPKDVIITGFDNLPETEIFYPSISSIDPDSHLHGFICAKTMADLLNGRPTDTTIKLPSSFITRESCGCTLDPGPALKRLRVATDAFKNNRKKDRGNWHIFGLERLMLKCESVDELRKTLSDSLSHEHFFEGDDFHILFDACAYKTLTSYDLDYTDDSDYSERQDVIFSIRNGNIQNIRYVESSQLVPGISDDDPCHMYVILPIHEGPHKIGFVVFSDCYDGIASKEVMLFMEKINSSMAHSKKSIYLKAVNEYVREMSNIDSLTSVKNRSAYEARLDELKKRIAAGTLSEAGIVLFDVNNLKRINDELGHYKGDEYLKNACHLICMTYKSSPVYRIGGDEFVVILEGRSYEARTELLDAFVKEMEKIEGSDAAPEEKVSIAYGMAVYNGEGDGIDAVVKRADELMYETKKRMKGLTGKT